MLPKPITSITKVLAFLLFAGNALPGHAQAFPSEDENIPWLITFGAQGDKSWGDDDFCQVFFFSIPKTQTAPFYIRVFDPDVGGLNDEMKGDFNSETKISIYGGKDCYSLPDAKGNSPTGKYDSGNLIYSKSFGVNATYDNNWYTFGPYNPSEGEYAPEYDANVFKVIINGSSGDDGNVYRFYLSTNSASNLKVEGGNAFTYEYTFRLPDKPGTCHIYPYVDSKVVSVQQHNFDWDYDGVIRMVSTARIGESVAVSTDNNWATSKHPIAEVERNTSLDIQFIKQKTVHNNNVVVRVTNQYDEALPFFSIPLGGKPKYKGGVGLVKKP